MRRHIPLARQTWLDRWQPPCGSSGCHTALLPQYKPAADRALPRWLFEKSSPSHCLDSRLPTTACGYYRSLIFIHRHENGQQDFAGRFFAESQEKGVTLFHWLKKLDSESEWKILTVRRLCLLWLRRRLLSFAPASASGFTI